MDEKIFDRYPSVTMNTFNGLFPEKFFYVTNSISSYMLNHIILGFLLNS